MHQCTPQQRTNYKRTLTALTPLEMEVLYGMVLSDASISISPEGRNGVVQFAQSVQQAALVEHLFAIFKRWSWQARPTIHTHHRRTPDRVYAPTQTLRFRTFAHPVFTAIHHEFYGRRTTDQKWIKRVPTDVRSWLTPRVLAYHLMGDGSFQHKQAFLHTEGFTKADIQRYAEALNAQFGLHCYPRIHRRVYWKLVFPTRDLPTLQALLSAYVLPMFAYKLGLTPDRVGSTVR